MYYTILTKIVKEGENSQQIFAYEALNAAESRYHEENSSDYVSTNIKTSANMVVDDLGNVAGGFKKYFGVSTPAEDDKYYLVSLQETEAGQFPCTITAYDDANTALSAMENELRSDCVSETLKSYSCFVLNKIGGKLGGGSNKEEEPAPEPNEE